MENELHTVNQNTLTNEHCLNPLNNIPKAEYGIVRSEEYVSEVQSFCDAVHDYCSESYGLAQIGMEGGQDIDGHAQPQL